MNKLLVGLMVGTCLGSLSSVSYAQSEDGASFERRNALEEILVTATRREERLQTVPVAVTALGEDTMERLQISNLVDAAGAAPNVSLFKNPSSSSSSVIYIRGIGDDASNILREFPISQYIDGVYIGRNMGALLDMVGYERIEVLRGPQGTLYGRNSTGGAVKLVTKRPDFDEFAVKGDATIGSFNRRDIRAMVNIPLSDTLATNIAFGNSSNDGAYRNVGTGERMNNTDLQSIRAGVLWKPTDRLSFYLTGDFSHDTSGIQVPTQMSGSTGAAKDIPLYGGFRTANPNVDDVNKVDVWGVGLQADYEFEQGNLQSVTAYRGVSFRANYDYGGAPIGPDLFRDSTQRQFSQEFQFSSNFSGPFQFISGVFFFRETGTAYEGFAFVPTLPPTDYGFEIESESYAAYTEATLEFNDWLTGTLGARVTHDSKNMKRITVFDGVRGDDSWTKFTPKVGLKAQINPDMMAYATFSQGYKAGIYLPYPGTVGQASTALPPENVDAFEAGLKADWLDGRLRTNIAVFYNKNKDLQLGVLGDGGATSVVSADLDAWGIEFEFSATPTDNLYIFGTANYLDTKFVRVPTGSAYPAYGDEQRFSPPLTLRIGAEYSIPVGNGNAVKVGGTYSWFDDQAQGFPNSLYEMDSYDLVDARIAYEPDNGNWGVELSGKNLTNSRYWSYQSYLAGYARYYATGTTWALKLKFDL